MKATRKGILIRIFKGMVFCGVFVYLVEITSGILQLLIGIIAIFSIFGIMLGEMEEK